MFATVLSYFNVTIVSCAVTFFATMVFSQKIKDWFAGVPAEVRTTLSAAETAVLSHIKTQNTAMVKTALVALGNAPAAPVAPVAPAAPAAPAA